MKKATLSELHLQCLPKAAQHALVACIKLKWLNDPAWYLAGGTALALQVGHRGSVDLDFFTRGNAFDENKLERQLMATNAWATSFRERGTVHGTLMGARLSFIAYPFFRPLRERLLCGTVRILLPQDIATMKIIAISQRGKKRDFLDLYWYCTHREHLEELLLRGMKQYPGQEKNLPHILKSLTYFEDAENDPFPRLFFKVKWGEVKKYFQNTVSALAKKVLYR
ncbi:MAG: nucleotidyl transferase AbiEii/AbiGii toxin family protein [Chlamydiae bacterium]|nr:nucleotidyl transferase AbiEii/AbiGii toxin family protein [Chlamydiota bacterium]MBI3266327.1 nucleotidyl transferase AbiEii/AbiGii toxin family protein [Chlamydiota bacterium]